MNLPTLSVKFGRGVDLDEILDMLFIGCESIYCCVARLLIMFWLNWTTPLAWASV
jgi:hypothetical protein